MKFQLLLLIFTFNVVTINLFKLRKHGSMKNQELTALTLIILIVHNIAKKKLC